VGLKYEVSADTLERPQRTLVSQTAIVATAVAVDVIILVGISTVGPLATVGLLACLTLTILAICLDCGLVLAVSVISGITVVGDIDLGMIRAAKWGLVGLLTALALARMGYQRKKIELCSDSVVTFFLLYFAWGVVCSLFAARQFESIAVLLQKTSFLVVYALTISSINRRSDLRLAVIVLSAFVILSGIASSLAIGTGQYQRFRGFTESANSYGAMLSVVVPMLCATFFLCRTKISRVLAGAAAAFAVICAGLSWSRSAWVTLAVTAVVFLLIEKRKKALAITGLVVASMLILVILSSSAWSVAYQVMRLRGGTTHRTVIWEAALKEIGESPIVGQGLGVKFGDVVNNVSANDPFVTFFISNRLSSFQPHSYYLFALVSMGIPGLLIFLHFLFSTCREQYRARQRIPDPRYRMLHSMTIALFVGASVGIAFDSGILMGSGSYANYFWIALGMVTAISRKRLLDEPHAGQDPAVVPQSRT
jgi:O-antigen ligase